MLASGTPSGVRPSPELNAAKRPPEQLCGERHHQDVDLIADGISILAKKDGPAEDEANG
jgi:hypothetical protein